jgi:hypothetical protein
MCSFWLAHADWRSVVRNCPTRICSRSNIQVLKKHLSSGTLYIAHPISRGGLWCHQDRGSCNLSFNTFHPSTSTYSVRAVRDENPTSISVNLLQDRAILYGLRAKSSRDLFLENDYSCSPFRSFHARAFVISRICELISANAETLPTITGNEAPSLAMLMPSS